MRNLSILLLFIVFLGSCESGKKFEIKGDVTDPSFEGTTVLLQEIKGRDAVDIDSAIVKNGKFEISGIAEAANIQVLSFDMSASQGMIPRTIVVVEPGRIKVKVDDVITVSGTKLNDKYNTFNTAQEGVNKEIQAVLEKFQNASQSGTLTPDMEENLRNEYEELYSEANSQVIDFIKANIDNGLGQFIFLSSSNGFDIDTQKEILSLSDDSFKANDDVKKIISGIEKSEKVAIGKKFTDFTMQNPKGENVSLSDYAGKGKVVLIDFWAAWCGPCRQEMPNVVEAYKAFKDKGFEIVGVSLDRTHEEWTKGLNDLDMTWPQMSDLKYWETPIVDLYAFRGIPHTVLLDADGVIVEKNLRGKDLHDKLSELLDK